jgi:hypothetical protein
MGFVRRTVKFGGGLVLGVAVSTAVSVLLAPQSGPELQGELSDLGEEAQRAGEEAEILETERLKREFRVAVNDPTALTGKFARPDAPPRLGAPQPAAQLEESKEEKEARKAREDAEKKRQQALKAEQEIQKQRQKAEEQVQKAEEKAAKADEKADKAEEKARKEQAEADEERARA